MVSCATAFSQHPEVPVAVGEVVGEVLERIDPHPDLVVVLAAGDHADALAAVMSAVESLLAPEVIIAASGLGVFGGAGEEPLPSGLAVFCLHAPGVAPLHLTAEGSNLTGWPSDCGSGSVALLFDRRRPGTPPLGTASPPAGVDVDVDVGVDVDVDVAALAFRRSGRGGGTAQALVNGDQRSADVVGVLFPPGVASLCELGLFDPFDEGGPPDAVGPPGLGDAEAVLLFADRGVALVGGPTLDFDVVFERLAGCLTGLIGEVSTVSAGEGATRPSVLGARAVALVFDGAPHF